jgi:hypothetical protein
MIKNKLINIQISMHLAEGGKRREMEEKREARCRIIIDLV